MNSALISVIIPCYNTGIYLEEAIDSVFNSNIEDFEIIIINDGSTQKETLEVLRRIEHEKISIISQDNLGLATARNIGVTSSKGDILLFLDSDNRIKNNYLKKATQVFNNFPKIDVIYCKPFFFGDDSPPRFQPIPFNFDALLSGNYIDACSLIRKSTFLKIGGFHVHPCLKGWEDWDLWIRLGFNKASFHFINEELFDYRVRIDSMMGQASEEQSIKLLKYLGEKYGYEIHKRYRYYQKLSVKFERKSVV